jgi:hypothetical protein
MNFLGQRDSVANKGKSSVVPLGLARIFFLSPFPTAYAVGSVIPPALRAGVIEASEFSIP